MLFFGLLLLIALTSSPARASDSCTILYRVDGTLQVTDTPLGKGDATIPNLPGQFVLEYKVKDGAVTDGKVKVLHYSMFERFEIETIADVTTSLHHYAPRCNGYEEPPWRLPSDPRFPKICRYRGSTAAVAVGQLDRDAGTIEWAKCKAAPSYWARGDEAYTPDAKSKGKGCLNDLHVVGNIHCDGRLACKIGALKRGDNPQYDHWTQPLIHGPPGASASITVSSDLSELRTPRSRRDGYQSYNLPNESPTRTWFSFTAVRDDGSRYTTCP